MSIQPVGRYFIVSIVLAGANAAIANPLPSRTVRNGVRDWDFDGKVILGHLGKDVCEWDARTGRLLQRLSGHKDSIDWVELSPDGKEAITTSGNFSGDRELRTSIRTCLWDLARGKLIKELDNEGPGSFSPDGRRILTGAWVDDRFYAYIGSARTGKRLASFPVAAPSLAFSPSGKYFLASDGLANVVVYGTRAGTVVGKGNFGYFYDSIARFAASDRTLVAWGRSGVKVWDFMARKVVFRLPDTMSTRVAKVNHGTSYVPVAEVSRGGTQILVGSALGVDLYEISSRRRLCHLSLPGLGSVSSLSVNGKHALVQIYTESNGGTYLGSEWNIRTGKILARFGGAPVCFSKNGKTFLTSPVTLTGPQKLAILSAKTGRVIRSLDLGTYRQGVNE